MNRKSKSIGCVVSLCLLAGSTLAASKAHQVSHAHYGLPNAVQSSASSVNAIPLVVTNNTYNTYNVKFNQSDGTKDSSEIYPKNDDRHIISINNPSWPVEVKIPDIGFDRWIDSSTPNVFIDDGGKSKSVVRVSHTTV